MLSRDCALTVAICWRYLERMPLFRRLAIGIGVAAAGAGLVVSLAGRGAGPWMAAALFLLALVGLVVSLTRDRAVSGGARGRPGAKDPAELMAELQRVRDSHEVEVEGLSLELTEGRQEIEQLRAELEMARQCLVDVEEQLEMARCAPESAAVANLADELTEAREAQRVESVMRRRAEAALQELDDHDHLTGLPSRRLLLDRLAIAIAHAQRHGHRVALILVGVDDMSRVNHDQGRAVGDELLRRVAILLEQAVRQGDTVSRLESDRFVVVLPRISEAESVGPVAGKLRAALHEAVDIGGHVLNVTASIGLALFPDDGQAPEALLDCAETAMQRVKQRGGDGFELHSFEIQARAAERLAFESALRLSLVQEGLRLYYQPIFGCEHGRLAAAEARLYWRDPRGAPDAAFVPLETTMLAVPLGQWTLLEACRQARSWRAAGHDAMIVSVKVLSPQFHHPALVKLVRRALVETGLAADALQLEVAEAELIRKPEAAIARLAELKDLGVLLCLDNFGAGEAVLSQLYRYSVDALKIDPAVVRNMTSDRNQEALAAAVVAMARARAIRVIADGVDQEGQRAILAQLRCDAVQGLLFGGPVSAADLDNMLERQRQAGPAPVG